MSSSLAHIPVHKRRRLAATLGLFAMLFVAVAAVSATGPDTAGMKTFVAVALVVAVLLALIGWGVIRSVHLDVAERHLDDAIVSAVRAKGGQLCDCGHEHDPTELHVVDAEPGDACAHDGTGAECAHSCDTCVLASLRPRSTAPAPSPRPSPAPATAGRPSPQPAPRRPAPTRS